jgi:hypothetical protein
MFVAVDPGENVGAATFSETGEDLGRTVVRLDSFRTNFLKTLCSQRLKEPPRSPKLIFIMEDYTLRQDMAINQTGSDMPASRCIGAVEMIASILGPERCEIHLQKPGNLKTALKWAGYPTLANKPRSWHCPDDLSAYAHGVFWLIQNNYRKHPIFG